MKQTKNILRKVLIGIATICLLLAVGITATYFFSDWYHEDDWEDFQSPDDLIVSLPVTNTPESSDTTESSDISTSSEPSDDVTNTDPSETDEPSSPPSSEVPEPIAVANPYTDYYLANEDMVGWLVLPGTVVDYPVMWTPGDENYYLKRGFDKKANNDGCLILDTDSNLDPLTTNLIIHGHYKKKGTMFACLHKYEDKDFYEDHKQIVLHTEEKQHNYEVIAVFRSQVYKKSDNVFKFYKFFQADTQEEFDNFYNNIKKLSMYDTGVTAEFGDNFLTLSTCAYHVENGRFVVVAKEVESGDYYLPIER